MSTKNINSFKSVFRSDLPASIVVFLVALPLCLGIALASGAPLFSGIIAGIVGGIVVGYASGSHIGVSGPAAGLAVIVLTAIQDLGSFEIFLVAVVLAGIIQWLTGMMGTTIDFASGVNMDGIGDLRHLQETLEMMDDSPLGTVFVNTMNPAGNISHWLILFIHRHIHSETNSTRFFTAE